MSVDEAAVLLLLSVQQVGHLARLGQIAGRKVGRVWDLDEQSVRQWKQQRPQMAERRGAAWRKGMILTRRQWRCRNCGTIGQRDRNYTCFRCGEAQHKKH